MEPQDAQTQEADLVLGPQRPLPVDVHVEGLAKGPDVADIPVPGTRLDHPVEPGLAEPRARRDELERTVLPGLGAEEHRGTAPGDREAHLDTRVRGAARPFDRVEPRVDHPAVRRELAKPPGVDTSPG